MLRHPQGGDSHLRPLRGYRRRGYDPVSPREYNEIREGYLKNTFHMTYTDQMISFQQIGSHLAYGDLYKIEIDGVVGCAAIEYVQKRRC